MEAGSAAAPDAGLLKLGHRLSLHLELREEIVGRRCHCNDREAYPGEAAVAASQAPRAASPGALRPAQRTSTWSFKLALRIFRVNSSSSCRPRSGGVRPAI